MTTIRASSSSSLSIRRIRGSSSTTSKPVLSDDDMVDAIEAMGQGIQDRGKAEPGDKTMIDAWLPATAAARSARLQGSPLGQCLSAALEAATRGAEATKDMVAAKGRSSRLGDRVIGHMDPGAASAVVLIEAIKRTFENLISGTGRRPISPETGCLARQRAVLRQCPADGDLHRQWQPD
ncbi:DAK2 domain-containing protein [Rhizobium sp. BK176]|uniref:DAK2 domain-containing protein n=1 Tax=Rhizobium sp. BK176 TaxID=2587071 RepID=UPI00286D9087|nr:DAK2 domain-containing protein [Rhizobium sp. BK176]